ncbi:uncharacterized protein [Nicotiana tomentosiformis]|uniref:uncharacterized protein n=1 Tax=Nicotiana tomentosiformis TaxID=4098 RepID=UPI00388C5D6F
MKRFYPLVSSKLPQSSSSSLIAISVKENLNKLVEQPQSSKKQRQGIDLDSLKTDPKERLPIRDFHPNERDEIRRGPCQPRYHKFLQRDFSGLKRCFNPKWFKRYYNWLEYSVIEDEAYCLYCYLFQDEGIHQGGGDVFSSLGFKSWHKKNRLDMHGSSSIHNQAIQSTKLEYKIRLKASIEVVRLLLNQGLAFRGHREDGSSLNKGLVDLSETLVKTKKHLNYPFVFRLMKFALLLPVATATVERTFSAMKLIKSELQNRMNDEFMSGCLVPYVERKIFNTISDETIMNTFQEMKTRRGQL